MRKTRDTLMGHIWRRLRGMSVGLWWWGCLGGNGWRRKEIRQMVECDGGRVMVQEHWQILYAMTPAALLPCLFPHRCPIPVNQ